jgi:hypothetical protein
MLPGGRVLLAAGDATGEQPPSAVRLRDTLVGIAFTGADPAGVLGCLNLVAFHGEGPRATAVVARFDPEERTLAWARAGNPQPILVRAGRARQLRTAEDVVALLEASGRDAEDAGGWRRRKGVTG